MDLKILPTSLINFFIKITKWALILIYLIIFTFTLASLFSFNINDGSFLTISSEPISNLMGRAGSHWASFIIYCFGVSSFIIPNFFLIASIHTFKNLNFDFIFLRFFVFLISIILFIQILVTYDISSDFFGEEFSWGLFNLTANKIMFNEYVAMTSSLFGFLGIILSTDFLKLIKIKPSFSFLKIKYKRREKNIFPRKKEEPTISKRNTYEQEKTLENFEEIDEQSNSYKKPSVDNLDLKKRLDDNNSNTKNGLKEDADYLEGIFIDFNIQIEVINIRVGPVVTLYEVLPAAGIKINTIINLADDISRSMGATSVRIAQVYGTKFIGVEIPNKKREVVSIRELIDSKEFLRSDHKIPICIGKDITGNNEVIDLSKTPHLLVAGTTGSGKSVFINSLLTSMLYKFEPSELRLILIDPKMIELSVYNDIPHLITPVVTEPKKSIMALKWVCAEMEKRYEMMNESGTRSLENYNSGVKVKLPFIVVVIDEMADLMMTAGKEVEHYVQRLAQKARACGIHLVMATQRPSVDIITGSIKANFPSRISFQVASKYDSRTILGEVGAEQLLGNGDMLMMKNGSGIIRYQSGFMSDKEVQKLINEIKRNQSSQYVEEVIEIINSEGYEGEGSQLSNEDEELVTKSIDLIKNSGRASTSYLQRNFQIGYNKAARIMEVLEQRGVVSKPSHTGKREILISS